jgi:hypothetical protein
MGISSHGTDKHKKILSRTIMASKVASTKKAAKVTKISRNTNTHPLELKHNVVRSVSGTNINRNVTTELSEVKVEAFFDELRQQYTNGKLSDRQIAAIKKRLPGVLDGVSPPAMTDERCESWIVEARTLYAAGKLPSWQIARIEQIPGWTWTKPTA